MAQVSVNPTYLGVTFDPQCEQENPREKRLCVCESRFHAQAQRLFAMSHEPRATHISGISPKPRSLLRQHDPAKLWILQVQSTQHLYGYKLCFPGPLASIRLFAALSDAQRDFVESPTKSAVNAVQKRASERPSITLCRRRGSERRRTEFAVPRPPPPPLQVQVPVKNIPSSPLLYIQSNPLNASPDNGSV